METTIADPTVSQMTASELRRMISDVVREELAPLTDPDYGLELREDFVERLLAQKKRFESGEDRGVPADQLYRELGLE